jgi:hypothetical protein
MDIEQVFRYLAHALDLVNEPHASNEEALVNLEYAIRNLINAVQILAEQQISDGK